ncbi:hypothetical protein HMPREF3214_01077 [Alloscardovia omnicolens]|uniref:Uncharacterized protein n=1 Tax=Alloscardovia omnicolens F0580 TaxID=1321816 RepID=U1SI42_9BIFI|nr:hypothetical protein HMPREF9244_01084 [Alloscardovia omnicolens F0580]KWZ73620.1 hypothetical protein HMPREF3214_01077 [Alloscardovia omnicolens]
MLPSSSAIAHDEYASVLFYNAEQRIFTHESRCCARCARTYMRGCEKSPKSMSKNSCLA